MPQNKTSLVRLKNELLILVRRYPYLFLPLVRRQYRSKKLNTEDLLTRESDLVIEGYCRCGNTFAAYAFMQAQPTPVSLAYHTHAPATVIQAARWHIPTLILIREPVATVASLMLKSPSLSIRQGIRGYIDFYQQIMPYSQSYLVATFEEVTTDFGRVLESLNRRFGTEFAVFDHCHENVQRVFEKIERVDRRIDAHDIGRLSVPLAERQGLKLAAKTRLEAPEFQAPLRRAEQVYRQFISQADQTSSSQLQ